MCIIDMKIGLHFPNVVHLFCEYFSLSILSDFEVMKKIFYFYLFVVRIVFLEFLGICRICKTQVNKIELCPAIIVLCCNIVAVILSMIVRTLFS